MNRFRIIKTVAKIATKEHSKLSFHNGLLYSALEYADNDLKYILDNFSVSKNFHIQHKLDTYIDAEELNGMLGIIPNRLCRALADFRQQAGVLDDYDTGDKLLQYYLYYRYAEQHPVEVLRLDEEFIRFYPDFESEIENTLKDSLLLKLRCDNISELSLPIRSLMFVYENSDKEDVPKDVFFKLQLWSERCIGKQEGEKLLSYYNPSTFGATIYYNVLKELCKVLKRYMTIQTIRSTPITVAALCYVYLINDGKGSRRTVYTKSQSELALNMVRHVCDKHYSGHESLDFAMVCKICSDSAYTYDTLESGDHRLTEDILDIIKRNTKHPEDSDRHNKMSNIVAHELMKFREGMHYREAIEVYNTRELLSAYIYYTAPKELMDDCMSSWAIVKELPDMRSNLPDKLRGLSDVAVLMDYINGLQICFHEDYYCELDFTELLSEGDKEILKGFVDVGAFCAYVSVNLSWFADTYWLDKGEGLFPIELISRYVTITSKYKDSNKIPVLTAVHNSEEFRNIVDNKVEMLRIGKTATHPLSPTGILAAAVLCMPDDVSDSILSDRDLELTDNDKNYLVESGIVRSTDDILEKVRSRIRRVDLKRCGIAAEESQLTTVDRMLAYIYYITECNS